MSDEDVVLYPRIFDTGGGIRIEIPVSDGVFINMEMADREAQDMVDIIQNKLNARLYLGGD